MSESDDSSEEGITVVEELIPEDLRLLIESDNSKTLDCELRSRVEEIEIEVVIQVMYYSCKLGSCNSLKILFEFNEAEEQRYFDAQLLFKTAILSKNCDVLETLLDSGLDISNCQELDSTPLMMVWEDCFELEPYQEQMSTLLIRRGADPNEKDRDGNTLLHKLVQTSYDKKIFRYLINNMKVDPYIADGENKTPLYKAALIPNKIAVTELLK